MKANIIGFGHSMPQNIISNDKLKEHMDTSDEWIRQRTGIINRQFSDVDTSVLAYQSALDALNDAKITKEDLDLIIVSTFTPDNFTPSCANLVYKYLELKTNIPTFDLNAACSGFIYGLNVARGFIESGIYKNILVIGAEVTSKFLDFDDRGCAVLFGDGAGSVILQASETGIIDTQINSKADIKEVLYAHTSHKLNNPLAKVIQSENHFLKMNGQEVFKFATSVFIKCLKEIKNNNNLEYDDIAYIIPHQANLRIIDFVAKATKINPDKFLTNLEQYGNTSAASIPMVLAENKHLFKKGDKIALIAFGAGLTYGYSLIEI